MIRGKYCQEGTRGWAQTGGAALTLCLVLSASCSARHPIWTVRAWETDRLRNLLTKQRIDAALRDGTHVRGRVEKVQKDFMKVEVKQSRGSGSVPIGLHNIPIDRFSTVHWFEGSRNRTLLSTLGLLSGVVFGLGFIATEKFGGGADFSMIVIAPIVGGFVGYQVGRQKEQRTLEIRRFQAAGGPLR